jgi:hypothetical protein
MESPSVLRRLRCPACDWQRQCGLDELLRRLRSLGMLRREARPSAEMILELIETRRADLTCDQCHRPGLQLEECDDPSDDWGMGRLCEICGQPLAPERLQLFPDVQRCATCSNESDRDDSEFCPRCGGRLTLKAIGGSGISRYRASCRDCGWRGR